MNAEAAGTMPDMQKPVKYRNKKIMQAARYMDCAHCGADDGTIVMAHSNHHDKGMGTKASDCYVAALCFFCHNIVDGRTLPDMTQLLRDALWTASHKNTITRLMDMKLLDQTALLLLVQSGSISASPSQS